MKSKDNRCIDCNYLTLDSHCTHHDPVKTMFLKKNDNRIKHPEVSWCVNIEIKKEKEKR